LVSKRIKDRSRRSGKIEEDACAAHVHLCRDMQPQQRVVHLSGGELEEPVLRSGGYGAAALRQLTSRDPGFGQERPGVNGVSFQIA
jgi:hypothetical protein